MEGNHTTWMSIWDCIISCPIVEILLQIHLPGLTAAGREHEYTDTNTISMGKAQIYVSFCKLEAGQDGHCGHI